MSSIEQKYQEIQKEMSVDGKITFTIRGSARLSGVHHTSLLKNFSSGAHNPSKLATKLINAGFQVVSFSEKGIPDLAQMLIMEYYAFDAGVYVTSEAINNFRVCATMGIRAWGQQILGWKSPDDEFKQQVLTSLALITTKLDVQEKELAFLKPMAEDFSRINLALTDLQELKPLLQQINEELKANPNQRVEKLSTWLNELGLTHITGGQRKSLGRIVSDFLKIGNLRPPDRTNCNYYPESMTPLIRLASQYLV